MTGLRERQKAGRRRDILDAAAALFKRDGFAAASIEQIAERAELSAGTVYNYFPSKGDLLLALVALDGQEVLGAGYRELDRMLAEQVSDLCRALQRGRRMPRRIDCDDAGQVLFFVCNTLFMEFVADDAMPLARMKERMVRQVHLLFDGLLD